MVTYKGLKIPRSNLITLELISLIITQEVVDPISNMCLIQTPTSFLGGYFSIAMSLPRPIFIVKKE